MKKSAVVVLILGIGLVVLLKVFQNAIPRITDPLSNTIILIGFVLFVLYYGGSRFRRNK